MFVSFRLVVVESILTVCATVSTIKSIARAPGFGDFGTARFYKDEFNS